MVVYLTEFGMIMKKKGGLYVIEKDKKVIKNIPSALVECVNVYSGSCITSQCLENLIKNNIYIFFFDFTNNLIGYFQPMQIEKSEIEYKQFKFYAENEKEKLQLSKKIITAKLTNGYRILKRLNRTRKNIEILKCINEIIININNIENCKTVNELMGIEGYCSRIYFKGISLIVGKKFMFEGRNKIPPKDPMNSLLNFGYSILYSEIISQIKNNNLSPYYGFMHKIKNGHAALASDIMEEFRYQIVDSVVINTLKSKEFSPENFILNLDNGGVYLDYKLRKIFISKIILKLNSKHKYYNKEISYRKNINNQILSYKHIINGADSSIYSPLVIR